MSKRILFLATFFIAVLVQTMAQAAPAVADSVPADTTMAGSDSNFFDRITQRRWFQATYLGAPLIASGLIVSSQDKKFRSLRNDFLPSFQHHIDDFTQLTPVAVMLGMKIAGVKSRSSWGRLAVSDAFAATMMFGTVQGLKNITHVTRPDGSNNHSFPSGHTATAFMAATMLSKEYGHISPWVTVGAYSMATATGLMRIANNKHWLSDVMVGAGVGIITTELGYWLADVIFKEKGLNVPKSARDNDITEVTKPSFFSYYMGFNVPMSRYDLSDDLSFKTSTGSTLGFEGAGFFSRYFGVGARISASNIRYIVNGEEAPDKSFKFYHFMAGPYAHLSLTRRWGVGLKLLMGEVWYPKYNFGDVKLNHKQGFVFGTGASINCNVRKKLFSGIFIDYNIQAPRSNSSNEYIHLMTLGAKVGVKL